VIGRLRYLRLTAARTRSPLVPLAACVFWVVGIYSYPRNEVGQTFGLTALLCCALAAWLVGAILAGEPAAQADMASAALGGRRPRAEMDLLLAVMVAAGLAVLFVGYPLLLTALGRSKTFAPHARAGDVAVALVSHLVCATLGGTIAILFGAPRIMRRATSAAAILTTLIVLVALSGRAGSVGGPASVAKAMSDARAGTLDGSEVVSWLGCAVLAAATLAVAEWWTRRRP
jgi:hypothetical protein